MGLLQFVRVVAMTVAPRTGALFANLAGNAGDGDVETGERATNQPAFGALGVISRALAETAGGAAEGIARATGDGLVPFAWRDLRLNKFFSNIKNGTVALVGYAAAFDSNEAKVDSDGNPQSTVRVIYVPYAFDAGVPTKAHAITIDGTEGNESISIVHGDGMAITMAHGGKNSVTIKNKAGDAYLEVNDDGITLNGNVVVNGAMVVGDPTTAVPVLTSGPPSPSPTAALRASVMTP